MKFFSWNHVPEGKVCFESPSWIDKDGVKHEGYDPSVVDSSEYEQLKDVVERYIKTGDLRGVRMTVANYEIDDKTPSEVAIDSISPHRLRGFDIVDGKQFVDRTLKNLKNDVEEEKKSKAKEVEEKAAAQAAATVTK